MTPTPHVSPRRTARWSPSPIIQPISEPRPSLTIPRNSLQSAKLYATSSHRRVHYPAAEASSDRTANLLPPARWVPSHQPAAEVHRLYTILSKKRPITWLHVRGHSHQKWNDYVDNLADLDRRGSRHISAQGIVREDQTTTTQKPPPAAIPVTQGATFTSQNWTSPPALAPDTTGTRIPTPTSTPTQTPTITSPNSPPHSPTNIPPPPPSPYLHPCLHPPIHPRPHPQTPTRPPLRPHHRPYPRHSPHPYPHQHPHTHTHTHTHMRTHLHSLPPRHMCPNLRPRP